MLRDHLRSCLERRGWYLRRLRGVPNGVDLYLDLKYKLGANLQCVFDVGAHRGETILHVRRVFPDASVFAFEPVSENFAALSARFGDSAGMTFFQCALGVAEERVHIAVQQDSQTHSLRLSRARQERGEAVEEVVVRRLDDVIRDTSVRSIDLLKIDTEGFELEVLQGAKRALADGVIQTLVCEATLDRDDSIHSELGPLQAYLDGFGFRLAGFYDQVCWPGPLRLAYFNVLFVRS